MSKNSKNTYIPATLTESKASYCLYRITFLFFSLKSLQPILMFTTKKIFIGVTTCTVAYSFIPNVSATF